MVGLNPPAHAAVPVRWIIPRITSKATLAFMSQPVEGGGGAPRARNPRRRQTTEQADRPLADFAEADFYLSSIDPASRAE